MDKKSQLIKLLNVIAPDIDIAQWLLYLVENQTLDDTTLDLIDQMILQSYQLAKTQSQKDQIQKSMDLVTRIRAQEWLVNDKELDNLLDSIL